MSDNRPRLMYSGDSNLQGVLSELSQLHRFLLFAGPPGSGKTTLETRVAHDLRKQGRTLRRFSKFSARDLRAEEIMGPVQASRVQDPDWWRTVIKQNCLATLIVGSPDEYPEGPELSQKFGIKMPTVEELFRPRVLPQLLAGFLIDDPEGICCRNYGIENLNQACCEAEALGQRLSIELSWRHAQDWLAIFPFSEVVCPLASPWEIIRRAKKKWTPQSPVGRMRVIDALASQQLWEAGDYQYPSLVITFRNDTIGQLSQNVEMITSMLLESWPEPTDGETAARSPLNKSFMQQCIKCLSENVSKIVEQDHVYYFCANCSTKNERSYNNDGRLYTSIENGVIKHVTAAALVKKRNKYLLIHRRNFPYGWCVPSGHLEYNETPSESARRELWEETGLEATGSKLIFNETIIDQCKNGGDLHEWYLYGFEAEGKITLNDELNDYKWVTKEEIKSLENIVPPFRQVLYKIGFLDKKDSVPILTKTAPKLEHKPIEQSIIENLPLSIIVFDRLGNFLFANHVGANLLRSLKKKEKANYDVFIASLEKLAKRTIANNSSVIGMINAGDDNYNAVSNLLFDKEKTVGVTLTINNILSYREKEAKDVLTYQSLHAVGTLSKNSEVIKLVLDQTLKSLNIGGCSVMVLKKDKLETAIYYSKEPNRKHRPLKLKVGEGIAGKVALEGRPLIITDTRQDPSFVRSDTTEDMSLLCMPLVSGDVVYGVLNISKPVGSFFSEEETKAIKMVASRIALALREERLHEHIQEEKKLFETLVDTVTNGLIMLDDESKILFVNQTAKALLGNEDNPQFQFEDILSRIRDITSIIKFQRYFQRALKIKKQLNTELCLTGKSKRVLKVIFRPIIQEGKACRILIVLTDISDNVNKQKKIKRQISQITTLFKISSISLHNPAEFFQRILDKSAEILDSEYADIFLFSDLSSVPLRGGKPEARSVLNEIYRQKGAKNYISNNIRREFNYLGVKKTYKMIVVPLKINSGLVGMVYAVNKKGNYQSKDQQLLSIISNRIASRIQSDLLIQEIEDDREQFANIIAHSGDGIAVTDSLGNILIWNHAIADILGIENPKHVSDNKILKVLVPKGGRGKQLIDPKNSFYQEVEITHSDKKSRWVGITYSFVKNMPGSEYTITLVRDITKEKELEYKKNEFIYTATHELRTPLTAIKGYLSMILNGDAGYVNKKQNVFFSRAYQSTEKLTSLVEDLLQAAKLEEDKVNFELKQFNIFQLLGEVISDFKHKASSKNLKISANNSKEALLLYGDYDRIKQAVSNLVDNAIKYTESGEIKIQAEKQNNRYGRITVNDTGVGIPQKEQPYIFNKFYRVPNPVSIKAGGTGLGLFIVKNLIEKQGGQVWFSSQLGKGTIFNINLPLAKKS